MPVPSARLADALERVATGDKAAFGFVYNATCMKLYGIIIRILNSKELADEVLQEIYITIWQQAGRFDRRMASPTTWMATIARNRALDEVKRVPMRSIEEMPELLELAGDDNPHTTAETREDIARLYACLDKLGADRKHIILLAYQCALTREEIAARLGRPVSTIKTWLRLSLEQLKECLAL